MIEVTKVEEKTDRNGKQYKYFELYSPEQEIQVYQPNGVKSKVLTCSKYCGYVAYKVNYAESQTSDPMYEMQLGDKIEGRIVSKKVEPFIHNGELRNRYKVPVFCSEDDPIEFEIATIKAYKRAGKTITKGNLNFGDLSPFENYTPPTPNLIPPGCLVVERINNNY